MIENSEKSEQDIKDLNAQLIEAVRCGDIARIESTIKNGADINTRCSHGSTVLMHSVHLDFDHRTVEESVNLVKKLVDLGIDKSLTDTNNNTATDMAIHLGQCACSNNNSDLHNHCDEESRYTTPEACDGYRQIISLLSGKEAYISADGEVAL
ncbi:MAG: hypothetical protein RLN62_03270 [Rickettsiales bacterium]